ncbi:MAG: Gfo/Idh/MocA family oxidoreductase [Bacteroidota bacterium]
MKVAIIGSGLIAHTHAQAIRLLGHEITTVISATEENARKFAKKWSIPKWGTTIDLALANCDCVHLCTPPMVHYHHAKAAIQAKKHVLCEKPLTISPQEANELVKLAKEQKVLAAVNFNVRYHEASNRAKQLLSSPNFGDIQLIHGSYLQEFHASSDVYSWRYREKLGGKMRAVTEIGSHWVDLVRHWTGLEIVEVLAHFANFNRTRFLTNDGLIHRTEKDQSTSVEVHSEDAATILFKCTNGAIGNVVLSEVTHGKKNELSLTITGSQQALSWNSERPYQLELGQKNRGIRVDTQPFADGFNGTFYALFEEFYNAISNDKKLVDCTFPTFYDGYINATICEAIYQSATNGSVWVNVLI